MRRPQRHPVGVHVAPGITLLADRVARLVGANGDLRVPVDQFDTAKSGAKFNIYSHKYRVPVSPKGTLVDIGAPDKDIAVIHDL